MFIVKCANSYEAQTKADGPTGAACVKSHTIHLARLCSYPASGVHTAANEMNCGGCLDSVRSGANRGTVSAQMVAVTVLQIVEPCFANWGTHFFFFYTT